MPRPAFLILLVSALAACTGGQTQPETPANDDPQLAGDDDSQVQAGEDALKANDFESAKKIFEAVLKSDPKHPKANHYLGVALEGLGDKAGAEKQYRAALTLDPSLAEPALNLSAMLVDAERYDEAIAVLEPALQRNPRDPLLRTNLAYARAGKGDVEGAVAAFQAALAVQDRAELRVRLAEILINAGRTDEGMLEARKAMAAAPDQIEIVATAADLFRQAKRFVDCVEALDKAIALREAAELFAARGVCKRGNKDHPGAKADYERAVSVDPNYAPAYFLLGQHLLHVDNNRAAAVAAFEKCAAIDPNSKCKQAAEAAKGGK